MSDDVFEWKINGNPLKDQKVLVFDIETDGLIPEMTMVHSLVIRDLNSGYTLSCTDHEYGSDDPTIIHTDANETWGIEDGLRALLDSDVIIGHNIIDFDIPAIQKIYPWFKPKCTPRDTLVMTRLIWDNLLGADFTRERKGKWIEKYLYGRHSLEAWGQRLGVWKGDYGQIKKEEGKAGGLSGEDLIKYVWGTWSADMQIYCEQDVEVTTKLFLKCLNKGFSEDSIDLENAVRTIVSRQERYGFAFDDEGAHELYSTLAGAKAEMEGTLVDTFRPWYRSEGRDKPKIDRNVSRKDLPPIGYVTHKTKGHYLLDKEGNRRPIYPKVHYSADAPYTRVKLKPFNPGSRQDIADRLIKLFGWKPREFTNDGHPKVDEEILKSLPWEEARLLTKYLMIQKRLGQVAEGKEAWLRHSKNGRIHGSVNTNGAVTSRMTHSKPNIAQVPGIHDKKTGELLPYGRECRALFTVSPGKLLVGCDADALELRDLAGYMAAFDGGKYIRTVLDGNKADGTDMHTLNAKALGCSREVAKTWFYAFIYGSGDYNLGVILGTPGNKAQITAAGKASRAKFLKSLPALKKLVTRVKNKAIRQKKLRGLDGRILNIRSAHAALNTLLQSAGAIQMKRALVILDDNLQAMGLVPGQNYEFVANVHDEWQIEVDEDKAHAVGEAAADAIRLSGEYYEFRCPLAGNYEVGKNWAETH